MPIDTKHPAYEVALPSWITVLDVLGGERAVKAAGDQYLPMLAEQPPEEYQAYKQRAIFFGATLQTHLTFVGFLFRKDPVFLFPDSLKDFMDDATLAGYTFYDFLKDVGRAVTSTGRRGTFIDWDEITGRPFVKPYNERSIINWKSQRIGNQIVLTTLVLEEQSDRDYGLGDAPARDEYDQGTTTQWRVYKLEMGSDNVPFLHSYVYRRKAQNASVTTATGVNGGMRALPGTGPGGGDGWVLCEDSIPTRRGVPLRRIPFVFHGPNNHLPEVDRVPMEPMASLNISHYQTSADLENVRHICGIPTPVFTGFNTDDGDKIRLGSTTAMTSDNPNAKAEFLSLGADGVKSLTDAMEQKEKQMSNLGAQFFDPSGNKGKNPIAYDTARILQTGETVTLTTVALALTQSCSLVIQWAAWWMGSDDAPEDLTKVASVAINTEFVTSKLDPATVTALLAARAAREMSRTAFFHNMQEGEMYPPDWTQEEEDDEIASEPPPTPPAMPGQDGGGDNFANSSPYDS